MTDTWRIPSFRIEELRRRVDVLNRRVSKTGGRGLSVDVTREYTVGPEDALERWSEVVVSGEVPRVGGWDFVARVEHHPSGNIVSCAPGSLVELPNSFRLSAAFCSHCEAARNRKDTFVLHKDGDLRQVGRNCLADFLRSGSPEVALRVWSLLAAVRSLLDEASEAGFGASGPRGFGTVRFLACTAAVVRDRGWVSKGKARDSGAIPTASLASFAAGPRPSGRTADEWLRLQPTDEDMAEAGEVVAWAESLEIGPEQDYLHNLRSAITIGYVERRNEGLVASGVAARRRELEKAAEAARGPSAPGEHVGVVDKRYDLRGLVVKAAQTISNDWGTSLMLVLEDQGGNDLKCFLRGASFVVGDILGGRATVKSHEEFRGRKVTVLTRCKLETGLPVQRVLLPVVTAPPPSSHHFSDSEIPF